MKKLLILALCLAGCTVKTPTPVPEKEAAENLKWFHDHYYDEPLTRKLNEK